MFKYTNAFTNRSGDSLPGYFAKLYDSGGNQVDIFADASSTPISTVSGVANAALSDENGMFRWYVANGTYDIRFYDSNDVFISVETGVPMFEASGVYTDLSADTGAGLVGSTGSITVQASLDARPTSATLAASGGAALVGFIQAGTGATATSQQERLRREVWAEDFMTLPATGDQTAAFQAAIDSLPAGGGIVKFRGDYTVGTTTAILFPAEPKVVFLDGEGRSTLRQGAANLPIIAKVGGVSRVIGAHIKGFTVVAHVNSLKATATNILINIAGFDWSLIDVEYQSNAVNTATEGRAHAVIAGHANGIPCYGNTIRVKLAQTVGPSKGVWLHNNGGTSLANANANKVSVWGYAMTGCDYLVDAADSTQTIVDFGLLEDCPDSIGVRMGNYTKIKDKWPELLLAIAEFGATASTTANNCIVEFTQLSGNGTFIITDTVVAPPRFNDVLFSGASHFIKSVAARAIGTISGTVLTVTSVQSGALAVGQSVGNALTGTTITSLGTGTGGTGTYNISVSQTVSSATTFVLGVPTTNYIMPTVAKAQAAGPGFALVLIGGTVTADLNSLRHRTDHHGVTTYMMRWNITPAGTGREIMRLTPPTGYEIEQASFSVINVGVAQPLPVGLSNASTGDDWEVWWPNVNVHTVNVRVTMRATS